ncbi:hypothetical protein EY643_16750 [Halioglobus maricola]|uniref:Nucleotide-diphospho-sugar transferase domain-containing protein n=1 Tax=Halioglobus maricola TaxID=2601894 RepID=A0A5P9NN35_9GAMM|nr:DUF6492 family protein [Halioglobus maricola]QFU77172.1 hypothetical protein EY643_16750 [Halioglobus maricola]
MQNSLEIITCSYGPDLDRCRRLCESIDRHVSGDIRHALVVPARDYKDFISLANERRSVRVVEEVLPSGYRQLPWSDRWWVDNRGWPVRGWMMQQLAKLSADKVTEAELILFADSDLVFVRDFDIALVYSEDLLRLRREPGSAPSRDHIAWHCRSAELLGLAPGYGGSDYVGQLVTWRRSQLVAMKAHIEQLGGRPWHRLFARSLRCSEYTLYGMYVEHVARERHGHFYEPGELCHCCWFSEDVESLASQQSRIADGSIALLLQSNIGLSAARENAIVKSARAQLALGEGGLAA